MLEPIIIRIVMVVSILHFLVRPKYPHFSVARYPKNGQEIKPFYLMSCRCLTAVYILQDVQV